MGFENNDRDKTLMIRDPRPALNKTSNANIKYEA